jgi:YD repeat-containing protein
MAGPLFSVRTISNKGVRMKRFALIIVFLLLSAVAYGQQDAPFGASQTDNGIDNINLFTLAPTIQVDIAHKKGAIPFNFTLYAPQTCDATNPQAQNQQNPCMGEFGGYSDTIYTSYSYLTTFQVQCPNTGMAYIFDNFTVLESGAAFSHQLPASDFIELNAPASGLLPQGNCTPQYSFTDVTIDGSGFTVTIAVAPGTTNANGFLSSSNPSVTLVDRGGRTAASNTTNNDATFTDPFGNAITQSGSPYNYTDTLGVLTMKTTWSGWHSSTADTYEYPDTTGTYQTVSINKGSTLYPVNVGNCVKGGGQGRSIYPVTSITFPDLTSLSNFTYEPGVGTGTYTGRISGFTTRQGGTISYSYSSPCTTYPLMFSRTTPDGTTSYTATLGANGAGKDYQITKVLDPGMNKTVYSFDQADLYYNGDNGISYDGWNNFLTEKDVYQNTGTVASPVYTLLTKDVYCYNTNTSNCTGAAVAYPITQRDTYHYIDQTSVLMTHETETWDKYGNQLTDIIVDSISGQTETTTTEYGSFLNGACNGTLNSNIHDHVCRITTKMGSTQIAQTTYAYNANGVPTAKTSWLSSTSQLTTNYTPNPNGNGTITSVQLPTGQSITYGFTDTGGCSGLLPTSTSTTIVQTQVTLNTSQQWDCNSALLTKEFDANNQPMAFTYDSMLRPSSQTDARGFVINYSYTFDSETKAWTMTSPVASSSTTTTFDGLGRTVNVQTTDGGNYDTVSAFHGYSPGYSPNFYNETTEPCTTTGVGATGCPLTGTPSYDHYNFVDPLGRSVSMSTNNREVLTYTYSANDAQVQLTPVPSLEHAKTTQTEYDGFGRPKSVCSLLTSGGTSCGQAMGGSGILTSYTYSFGTGSSTIQAVRGSQTHTTVTDALGRVTSVATPEAATETTVWDTVNDAYCGNPTFNGSVVEKKDNAGQYQCPTYDGLGRVTGVWTTAGVAGDYCIAFVYDITTSPYTTAPSGYVGNNVKGRVVEALTYNDNNNATGGNCPSLPLPSVDWESDEWFSYDEDGRVTDVWEWTPHSGGYYHTMVGYNLNGSVASLSGVPNFSGFTWGYDTNGRTKTFSDGSTTVINGITYDAGWRPTTVMIGTSGDSDGYIYDPYTGNMTNYSFAVNGLSDAGTVNWNSNGTLGSLAITDTFNSGGSQTCTFGYDDVPRITSDSCTGGPNWSQTFDYGPIASDPAGQYENLIKSGSVSWNPGYNLTNNEFQNGSTYDGAGRLTYDGTWSYSYNAYGQMVGTINGHTSPTCGSTGYCVTYDAFGRPVETTNGSQILQNLYSPIGRVAHMSGQTTTSVYMPTPGGEAYYASPTVHTIQHSDWLGTKRLRTSLDNRQFIYDTAYAPYGETYDTFGSVTKDFTGDLQVIAPGQNLFDTPNRELATNASRWLTPDPAGASWNAYSYPTDPNSEIDPSGLSSEESDFCADLCTNKMQSQDPTPGGTKPLLQQIWDWLRGKDNHSSPPPEDPRLSAGTLLQSQGVGSRPRGSNQRDRIRGNGDRGTFSITLGGTRVKGNYFFGETGVLKDGVAPGAIIRATADCTNCTWIQTVNSSEHATTTDVDYTQKSDLDPRKNSPLYDAPSGNYFSDKPMAGGLRSRVYGATFVTILGIADQNNLTFRAIGAMSWAYNVDAQGQVHGIVPDVANPGQLPAALTIVRSEFSAWTIY